MPGLKSAGDTAHSAPAAGLRAPLTGPAPGPLVQAAMSGPCGLDEPAGRKAYLCGSGSGMFLCLRAIGLPVW
jgi:hypothetical protein